MNRSQNWYDNGPDPCEQSTFPVQKSDRYDNGTISFPCERSLRVRIFCQIHGLTVFPNKHMVNWRSYSGLPCVSDRVKTVSRFLLFLTLRVRLFCQIHGLKHAKHMVNWRSYSDLPCVSDRV